MRLRLPFRLATVTIAGLALVALGGCAAEPAPIPTQTQTQTQDLAAACASVGSAVEDAVTAFAEVDPTDPQAAAVALTRVGAGLQRAAESVEGTDLAGLLPDLSAAFDTAAETLTAIAEGDLGKLAQLQETTAEVQKAFATFTELCGAG